MTDFTITDAVVSAPSYAGYYHNRRDAWQYGVHPHALENSRGDERLLTHGEGKKRKVDIDVS